MHLLRFNGLAAAFLFTLWSGLGLSTAMAADQEKGATATAKMLYLAAKDDDDDDDNSRQASRRHAHKVAKVVAEKHGHHAADDDSDDDDDSRKSAHHATRHHVAAKRHVADDDSDDDDDSRKSARHTTRHHVAAKRHVADDDSDDDDDSRKSAHHAARHHRTVAHHHRIRHRVHPVAVVPETPPPAPPVVEEQAAPVPATSERPATPRHVPALRVSAARAMVVQEDTGAVLFEKDIDRVSPIASVTKLMTAMVVLDRDLPMDEEITILEEDVDHIKHSSSRLQVGTVLTRRQALQLALMSSENRAAAALGRTYPGGTAIFVAAMNHKAQELKMSSSYFADPTGLNAANVSTAEDLVKMARAARHYEVIRNITTTSSYELGVGRKKRPTMFINTNRLVRAGSLDIGLSKTGYINEAGHCLVMQVRIGNTPVIMTLLDNAGKYSCQADALRIRQWLQRVHLD